MSAAQRHRMRQAWALRQGYNRREPGGEGPASRSGCLTFPYQRMFFGPNAERKAARDLTAHPLHMLAPVTITVGAWP